MSKMNELSQTLDELIACGESLIRVAQELKAVFTATTEDTVETQDTPAVVEQPTAPEPEPVRYSFTDVRKASAEKSHAGFTAQVKALITKYGASRLSDVKEEDYPALMADLEVIV